MNAAPRSSRHCLSIQIRFNAVGRSLSCEIGERCSLPSLLALIVSISLLSSIKLGLPSQDFQIDQTVTTTKRKDTKQTEAGHRIQTTFTTPNRGFFAFVPRKRTTSRTPRRGLNPFATWKHSASPAKRSKLYFGNATHKALLQARAEILRRYPDEATCSKFQGWEETAVIIGRSNATDRELALRESEGFFEETSSAWRLRKQTHFSQMCSQAAAMRDNKTFEAESLQFYQANYEPSFSCAFEQRIGQYSDGGKWVCDPNKLFTRTQSGKSCLVYSVGSCGDYSFESAVAASISPKCEIHTIDMNNLTNYTKIPPPSSMHYHVYKIGNVTIADVMRALGHTNRSIDIFKIDCEGCEWGSYRQWFDAGVYIRQILVEVHSGGAENSEITHKFFNFLFDLGYVLFHKEPNIANIAGEAVAVEFAFLKLSPSFSRALSLEGPPPA